MIYINWQIIISSTLIVITCINGRQLMRISVLIIIFSGILIFASCKNENNVYRAARLNEEGLRLFDAGKTEEAITLFHQATIYSSDLDSNKRIYCSNLAVAHKLIGNIDSAKFFLKKSIDLSEKNSYMYYANYGQLYLLDSMFEKSLNVLEKSYSLNNQYGPTNNLLGLFYLGIYDSALYDPQKALPYNLKASVGTNDVNAKYVLAQNYYYLEMVEKAVALFKELHRDYPDNIGYLATTIMMEQELGNDASFFLDKMKNLDPDTYQDLINNPVETGSHILEWD